MMFIVWLGLKHSVVWKNWKTLLRECHQYKPLLMCVMMYMGACFVCGQTGHCSIYGYIRLMVAFAVCWVTDVARRKYTCRGVGYLSCVGVTTVGDAVH